MEFRTTSEKVLAEFDIIILPDGVLSIPAPPLLVRRYTDI
jgi:hypothetical protein